MDRHIPDVLVSGGYTELQRTSGYRDGADRDIFAQHGHHEDIGAAYPVPITSSNLIAVAVRERRVVHSRSPVWSRPPAAGCRASWI